jgi:hypothetical protein
VIAKRKCNIKSEYPCIKCVKENIECTLCNAKFCIAHGGRSKVVNHAKKKQLAVQNKASNKSISNYLSTKIINFSMLNTMYYLFFVFINFVSCPVFYQMSRSLGEKWKCPIFEKYYGNPSLHK